MDVLIVAKTHMSNSACVGGILANGRFVRLLDSKGHNQNSDTMLNIGDVYDITFTERAEKKPPHIEDILVSIFEFKFNYSIDKTAEILRRRVSIWHGSSDILFDGKLQWTSGGSGYISNSGGIPNSSVGFWIPDNDLTRNDYNGKVRYSYPIRWRNIAFVGFHEPIDRIPAGTLVRVSLARWWSQNEDEEKKCYLQISGWY